MKRVRTPSMELAVRWASLSACAALCLFGSSSAWAASCHAGKATSSLVGEPAVKVAWRAGLLGPTSVYRTPAVGSHARDVVRPRQASWLLVLAAARTPDGRCWVKVRLPTRPNTASGWIQNEQVRLRATAWRIEVSRAARTLIVIRGGRVVRRIAVVVGASATPTPKGLFSIIGAWRSPPNAFLGSWILPLTAHSDVLQQFEGGDGTVGIHGRGGASLLDPLGSARSHGCVRLDNDAIDWLVRSIGAAQIAGIPVGVS
jgi:lipoprotein-anchoring transpeptidase ErfK/SrfK